MTQNQRSAPRAAARIRNDALRDQLLAMLRDADGLPLSTIELAERLGPLDIVERAHRCPTCECPPKVTAAPNPVQAWGSRIYPLLDVLAKRGVLERWKFPATRSVSWRLP